jgi:colanic acid/amylovoran biosynthesis glycosyltransferase
MPEPAICIALGWDVKYCETFIRSRIERLPARVHVLSGILPPMKGPSTSIFSNYLKDNEIEAVLAEYGPTGVASMDVCEQFGIPLIVQFHGYDAYKHDVLKKFNAAYPVLFKKAQAIICVSKKMQEQLLSLGAPREKLHNIPTGIDTTKFSGGMPDKVKPVFVSVGRFVDKKAPQLTLLAFYKVHEQFPDARLVMIGEGPLREACIQMARALSIEDAVEFPGVQPPEDIVRQLRRARAFVQHSIVPTDGNSEGTPNVIMEASATGIPVIATWHAGIPEVVMDNHTGLLVNEGDIDAMADAMIRLARDGNLAKAFGEAGQTKVRRECNVERRTQQLWDVIRSHIHE